MACARSALKRFKRPPGTGDRSIDATSFPGSLTSIPNRALRSPLLGVSSRAIRVPTSRKSLGSLSGASVGTGSAAACAASMPYVRRRPVGTWITAPRSARHVARSTFHACAAAVTSISRTVAPALCSGSHELRIALLPPVRIVRDHPAGFSGMGPSRIADQSASSSSARIMARPVCDPWPISDLSSVRVTMPSVPMRTQALGANGAALVPGAAFARHGRTKAITRPAVVSTNSRRETVELMGPPGCVRGARCAGASGDNRAPRTTHACSSYLPDRQLSDPLPRQDEQPRPERPRDRWCPRLTDTALGVGARHDVDLHHRHLGQPEHAVVVEVALLHAALVDRDLAPQRRGQAGHDGAL